MLQCVSKAFVLYCGGSATSSAALFSLVLKQSSEYLALWPKMNSNSKISTCWIHIINFTGLIEKIEKGGAHNTQLIAKNCWANGKNVCLQSCVAGSFIFLSLCWCCCFKWEKHRNMMIVRFISKWATTFRAYENPILIPCWYNVYSTHRYAAQKWNASVSLPPNVCICSHFTSAVKLLCYNMLLCHSICIAATVCWCRCYTVALLPLLFPFTSSLRPLPNPRSFTA